MIFSLQAAAIWNQFIDSPYVNAGRFTCYFGLHRWQEISTFGLLSKLVKQSHLENLKISDSLKQKKELIGSTFLNEFFSLYFRFAALISMICFCHDQIKALRTPFEVPRKRMRVYYLLIFFLPFLMFLLIGMISD